MIIRRIMKVYISGKIGEEIISDETRAKFAAAERVILERGHGVFNPTDPDWVDGMRQNYESAVKSFGDAVVPEYEYILMKDIIQLSHADAIYMLADWKQSPGARAEYAFAEAVGKRFFFEDRFQACEYLCDEMWNLVKTGYPPAEYLENGINAAEIAYGKKHLDRVWRPISKE